MLGQKQIKRKKSKQKWFSKLLRQIYRFIERINPFKSRPVKVENELKVPKEWFKKSKPLRDQKYVLVEPAKRKRKFRLGFLRTLKRIMALGLAVFNFIVGQASLASAPQTQALWLFFMANCYICIDYVWKTRKEPEVFGGKK